MYVPNLAQYTHTLLVVCITKIINPLLLLRTDSHRHLHYYHHYPSSFFAFWGGAHILKITFLAPCSPYFVLSVSLCPGKNAKKVGVCVCGTQFLFSPVYKVRWRRGE